ncbi:MAG: hypothetical protein KAJ73_01115 [Zetaproteobacteria bacterium]|nr:hypothetical protein [Zetaproteobacteria bacterium]
MAHEITDTLDKDIITIVQQCLAGKIDSGQAMKRVRRAQRLAAVSRYQVPISIKGTELTDDQLDRLTRILGLEL